MFENAWKYERILARTLWSVYFEGGLPIRSCHSCSVRSKLASWTTSNFQLSLLAVYQTIGVLPHSSISCISVCKSVCTTSSTSFVILWMKRQTLLRRRRLKSCLCFVDFDAPHRRHRERWVQFWLGPGKRDPCADKSRANAGEEY